jgi:hypothetical protein
METWNLTETFEHACSEHQLVKMSCRNGSDTVSAESLYFLSFAMKLWAGIENSTIKSFGHRARRPEMFSSDGVPIT